MRRPKDERYNVLRAAAERALTGWPIDEEADVKRAKDPKKRDLRPGSDVMVPKAPRVAARSMPGTTPMKKSGY